VLVVAALAGLTVGSADGRPACCGVSPGTVIWIGSETLTASRIDPDGRTPISYKAEFSWDVTMAYDAASKTFRATKGSVSVKGTASRFVAGAGASYSGPGQPPCSGPVEGLAGPPASSIDSSGNVVFQEAAIPGWPGGEPVGACYGGVITPILPDYSHADVEFKAQAKLSSLLDGTASASDSGGFTNTSTYQGSVCIKGCVAVTAATSGGYVPVGGGKLSPAKPNPTDPVYTNKATLTWTSSVSATVGCGSTTRTTAAVSREAAAARADSSDDLQIIDLLKGGKIDGTTRTAVTGQHMRLQAFCNTVKPKSVRWSIEGLSTAEPLDSSAIEGLTVGRSPRPLTSADRGRNIVEFYFFQPGTWKVTVRDRGSSGSATVTFRVVKPDPGYQPLKWGRVITSNRAPGDHTLDHMILITSLEYRYTPQLPADVQPGRFAITQLITRNQSATIPGQPPIVANVGPSLDNCIYLTLAQPRAASVSVSSPGSTEFRFIDAPFISLGPPIPATAKSPAVPGVPQAFGIRARLNVTLNTYLIFIPKDGVPVGLGATRMNFIGQARHGIGASPMGWTLDGTQKEPNGETSVSANRVIEPTWTTRVQNTAAYDCPPPPEDGLGNPAAVLPP
jgi:hypothetical protein